MLRRILTTLVTLVAFSTIVVSTAFAADDKCEKVPGSYIRVRALAGDPFSLLDQLTLGSDGTARWYQSNAFHLLVTEGSFIPEVGSWKCQRDGTVLVTTIGASYRSEILPGGITDIKLDHYTRFTSTYSIIDKDTLQTIRRVFRDFALTADPLDPNGGTNIRDSSLVTQFKRVKPLASDIP